MSVKNKTRKRQKCGRKKKTDPTVGKLQLQQLNNFRETLNHREINAKKRVEKIMKKKSVFPHTQPELFG